MASGALIARVCAGLVVGILVGLTGIGGGILLVPMLTSLFGVPPLVAVGSDAVVNCVTKIGAGIVHWRRGNVSWRLVASLAVGSVPAAVVGVVLLTAFHASHGAGVDRFLKTTIAVLLIVIPLLSLYTRPALTQAEASSDLRKHRAGIALIGMCVGLLVGITSIGSGTVTLMLLLVFFGYAPALLVGTDVVHALLLTGVTSLLQMRLGNVDYAVVAPILVGSIPGGILGAQVANRIPAGKLKQLLFVVLIAFGARMLWEGMFRGH